MPVSKKEHEKLEEKVNMLESIVFQLNAKVEALKEDKKNQYFA